MFQPEYISTVQSIARRIFGTDVRLAESQVSVGTTATRIAPNNPRRVQLFVVNQGSTNVYYAFTGSGQPVTLSVSDFIPPGGWQQWLVTEDGEMVGYELVGLSNTAGQTLDVQEWQAV